MPPTVKFDQGALPAGVVNQSRSDISLGAAVTITAGSVVGVAVFGLLRRPTGSAAALAGGPGGLTRTVTPDVAGKYRVRVIDDNDGSETVHTFTVRTQRRQLAIPAFNERANAQANEVDADPGTWVNDAETNEGGVFTGWDPDIEDLFLKFEATAKQLASVQVRRTTAFILSTAFADVTFDVTDNESDAEVIDHDLGVNSDNLIAGAPGRYLVTYWLYGQLDNGDGVEARVRVNDTTVLPGCEGFSGTDSHNQLHDYQVSRSFIAVLAVDDFITLQLRVDAVGTSTANAGIVFGAVYLGP